MGRMSKGDQLAQVLGTLDEVNSWIGVCRSQLSVDSYQLTTIDKELKRIQNNIMIITTSLAGSKKRMKPGEVKHLEILIDKLTEEMPPLNKFIYPVGYLQLARAECRRCEREVVSYQLTVSSLPDGQILRYLNRLSDALFTMGRWVNFKMGIVEEKWE